MRRPHLPSVVVSADPWEAPDTYHRPLWHPDEPLWHDTVRSYLGGHIRAAAPIIEISLMVAGVLLLINLAVMALL